MRTLMRRMLPAALSAAALAALAMAAVLAGPHRTTEATHLMPCADIDGDTAVSQVDIDIETSYYFQTVPPAPAAADLVPSGTITLPDLTAVAGGLGMYTLCQDTPFTWKGGTPPKGGGTVDSVDLDGDGCPDASENLASPADGGMRDYLNPWDYFNPSGDGLNRVDDILDVVTQFFVNFPAAGYTTTTDRSPLGPGAWNLGPPDGLQGTFDILASVYQFFHDCP